MKFEMDKVGKKIYDSSEIKVGEIICGKNSESIYKVIEKMIGNEKIKVLDMKTDDVKVIVIGKFWAHHKYSDYDEIESEDW